MLRAREDWSVGDWERRFRLDLPTAEWRPGAGRQQRRKERGNQLAGVEVVEAKGWSPEMSTPPLERRREQCHPLYPIGHRSVSEGRSSQV